MTPRNLEVASGTYVLVVETVNAFPHCPARNVTVTAAHVAVADVTPDRLVKSYHRRWHRGHGRHCAAMRLREIVPADMGPMSEPRDIVSLFGSPAFVYADLPRLAALWVRAFVRREDTFFYANKLRHVWSYLRTRWALHSARGTTHAVGEIEHHLVENVDPVRQRE